MTNLLKTNLLPNFYSFSLPRHLPFKYFHTHKPLLTHTPIQCTGCIRTGVGYQERSVTCQYYNGTKSVEERECFNEKPVTRTECLNEDCLPVWVPGPWLPVRHKHSSNKHSHPTNILILKNKLFTSEFMRDSFLVKSENGLFQSVALRVSISASLLREKESGRNRERERVMFVE